MDKSLRCVLKWTAICIVLSLARAEIQKDACCETIFLFATGTVGEHQSALMGRYNYEDVYNERPYFTKMFQNKTYFFFYQPAEISGGPAWIVGSELGGLTLNIVARGNSGKNKNPELDDDQPDCPVGIKGAYDRNETFDETFMVECEDSASTVETGPKCCSIITVKAEGDISKNHIVRLGTYNKTGTFNGHALYHINQYNYDSYLYYRKKGRSADGWTIGSEPGQETFSITTRNRTNCPNEVTHGFDRDREADPTFSIVCEIDDGDEPILLDEFDNNDIDRNDVDKNENDGKEKPEASSSTSAAPSIHSMFRTMQILITIYICTFLRN